VKGFGIGSGDVEAFRADVRRNMEREVEARIRAEVKRQVIEQLLDANPIAVPAALTEQETGSLRGESLRSMGVAEDDPHAPPPAEFRDAAERRVRLGLLVAAVIQDNGIEVDRERVKAKVDEVCVPYEEPDKIRAMYFQNPQLLAQVENVVLEEQVVEWLVERARIVTKPVGFSDLMETA
jgi:trigger factor